MNISLQSHGSLNPGRPVVRASAMVLLLFLSGCTTQKREDFDAQHPINMQRTQEAWTALRRPPTQPEFLVEDFTPVISTRSMPLSRDAALPTHIKRVTFKLPGRRTLPTIMELVSSQIGIPIVLSPDALRPASSFSPGGSGGGASVGGGGQQGFGGPSAAPVFAAGPGLGALVVDAGDHQRTFELNYSGSLSGLFDQLAAMASLSWKYEEQRVVFFRSHTRSFTIKTMPGAFKLSSSLGGGGGGGGGAGGGTGGGGGGLGGDLESQVDFWTGLEATVKAMLSASGKMNLDKNAGILMVTDGHEVMGMVEQYIDQMNHLMMRQIALDVEVVTVDLNEAHAAGIDWSLIAGSLEFISPPATISAGTPFSVRLSGTNGKSSMLNALQTFGRVTSGYSGVVVTSNRTPAPISVSNSLTYVRQTTPGVVTGSSTGAVAASSGLTPGQVNTGTNIVLLPMILESNQVLVQCQVSISALKELTRFDSGSGASQQSIQLPNVDSFTVVQRMAIPVGQTMVIMGFDQARTGSSTNGPFGQLVTGSSGSGNRQSIVVMITPRITDL
jgi:type IVB pilus formation R64 PilN family outer membrane protein